MTDTDSRVVEAEESEEGDPVFAVDPEDYQKTKKLERIHKAKKEVLEIRGKRGDIIQDLGDNFTENGRQLYRQKFGQTVAQYGSELLPLIEDALSQGSLSEDDLSTDLIPNHRDHIVEFILLDGHAISEEEETETGEMVKVTQQYSMAVYRQLGRIERKLGLGLDLEEETPPAEI
jgi:hypothetical protein